jgi:HEAT repeat protein
MSGFGERLSQRQKGFKKGVDAEEARRKREDAAVQLRKQVRDEALQQKRRVNDGTPGAVPGETPNMVGDFSMQGSGMQAGFTPSPSFPLDQIPALTQMLLSEDPQAQFNATQQYRKLLSIEQNPPIQEVIQAGVVPRFVQFLKEINRPDLQFEAAWVLTNIASGTAEQTRVVVEHGALPIFVQLLQSPNDDVREQAVWALGNIAGDSPNFRDLVLQSGGLNPIMTVLRDSEKTSMMRNATWTLSNLCRGKPPPPFEWVSPALGTLANLIYSSDVEVLTDACWAISYLSDGPNERITAVIQSGVCRRLVELLGHTSPLVQTPALRAVGNIATGDDTQTQVILESGALVALVKLLSHPKKAIRKESCWTISNITAGNREQIQAVITNQLFPPVIHLLSTADFDIKKEAAWAISNATSGGSPQQIHYLVECGCIKPMVDLLTVSDAKIIGVALEALENVLKVGKQHQQEQNMAENPFAQAVEAAEGLTKIEQLQEDPNEDVYAKAMKILENYFPLEEDAQLEDDGANQGGGFQGFGTQMPQGGFNFGGPVNFGAQ